MAYSVSKTTNPVKRFFIFKSVFSKLFASVLLALVLFAVAMILLTRLFYDTSAHTRHQILATQVTQQIEPILIQFRIAQDKQQRLESRYLLAAIRRNLLTYAESVNARFGIYEGSTQQAVMLMEGLPTRLPPKPNELFSFFRHDDPNLPTQVQVMSQAGYVILYESNRPNRPPVPPAISFLTGLFLLLLIMSGMIWFITRTMTWRINQLSRQMTQFGEGNFSVRVTPAGNDEITTLAKGFNHAAERIETLMNANKLLLAHASHEIRTPITRIRLQVEMMSMLAEKLELPLQEKFYKRADAITHDLTGLNDLVESILLVSRLDAGTALDKMGEVDVFELIKTEVQHYPHANFIGSHVQMEGQTSLLTHLIRNLLDNAHLHGIPPVTVELYAIDELGHQVNLPIVIAKTAQNDEPTSENTPITLEHPPLSPLENPVLNSGVLTSSVLTSGVLTNDVLKRSVLEKPFYPSPFYKKTSDSQNIPDFQSLTFTHHNTMHHIPASSKTSNNAIPTPTQNLAIPDTPDSDNLAKESLTKDPLTKDSLAKEKLKKSSIFSRKKNLTSPAEILTYQRIRIAVIDQGKGIPLDKREQIFSPFVRLSQDKKGSGLGLSLVAQIVAAHHGTILTDTLDGHTRFLITLPVKQKPF